jgi:hypothetical protein
MHSINDFAMVSQGRVLIMDELCITGTATTNTHYEQVWSDKYRHVLHSYHQERQVSINLWAGIIGDCL